MRRIALGTVAVLFAAALVVAAPGAGAQADDTGRGGTPTPAAPPSGVGGDTAVTVATEAEYRQAIIDLSADGAGPHTITLTADFSIATAGDAQYTGTQALTIDGAGHTVTSAVADTSFLAFDSTADLTVQDLALVGFDRTFAGAAIYSEATTTTVLRSTFTDNSTTDSGGAIDAQSNILVEDSTFTGNESTFEGGAIDQSDAGTFTVSGSTFEGNTGVGSAEGAALSSEELDVLTVVNSSFTFNVGGSVINADEGPITLTYVTLHRNEVDEVSDGVVELSDGGELTAFGTVNAFIVGGPGCAGQTSTTSSYSWSDDGSCDFTGTGDTNMGADPGLEPIADNGGPTETMAIGEDSPLFDAIPTSACDPGLITDDQRGEPRPGNASAGCDIGAFELQLDDPPVPPPPTPGGGTGGTGTGPISGRPGFTG